MSHMSPMLAFEAVQRWAHFNEIVFIWREREREKGRTSVPECNLRIERETETKNSLTHKSQPRISASLLSMIQFAEPGCQTVGNQQYAI